MRTAARRAPTTVLLLALLLATPPAAAWSAAWSQPVDAGLGVRTSMLVAGELDARARGGVLGVLHVGDLAWEGAATLRACPDRAGEPDPDCLPTPATVHNRPALRIRSGGLLLQPLGEAEVNATVRGATGLLGGAGLTLNHWRPGPALHAAGAAHARVDAQSYLLRPLGKDTRIDLVSQEGARSFAGEAYTFRLDGAGPLRIAGEGLVLGLSDEGVVTLTRGGLARAEETLRVDDLLPLQRAVLPPEAPARRADLAVAFGPFQVVPALLDGVVAAHANLTFDGATRDGLTLLRVERAALTLEEGRWVGRGDATYLVEGDVMAAHPGARVDPPVLVPLLLALLALAGRLLTARETAPAPRRRAAWSLRLGGLLLLALLADLAAAPLLGVHPLLDAGALSPRSRVQLGLLAAAMALAAWGLVGWSVESLARTAFATRGRPAALLWPRVAGLAAAGVLLLLAHAALLSLAARALRL